VRSSRLSGCSSTPVPSATALRWQLGSIASPSETARRWPSSTSFGAAKQLSQHESSVSTSPSLPPAASAAALPAAVRAPRRGPAARDVGGIPACVAGHLATASTERPRTKSGGASLAWRAFGRLINKSGPFFRAPPRQNILRRQAPSILPAAGEETFQWAGTRAIFVRDVGAGRAHLRLNSTSSSMVTARMMQHQQNRRRSPGAPTQPAQR